MRSGQLNREISVYRKSVTQEQVYGTQVVVWVPLVAAPGSPVLPERFAAEVQDVLPSRSESVRQGLALARNQVRLRMRWRNDIDSSMKIIVHGDTDVEYQIVGGPAEIGGRRVMLEMMLERYTS